MSAPLRPAALTRIRTCPAPGSGSGCSSTTIWSSRTVAAFMGLTLGNAVQQRDALDVGRLREHVDGPDPTQRVARLGQLGGIGRERRRVAGDVDDPLGA